MLQSDLSSFVKMLLCTIALTTVAVYFSFSRLRHSFNEETSSPAAGRALAQVSSRSPAAAKPSRQLGKVTTINLDCVHPGRKNFEIDARWVRFTGKSNCAQNANTTSGYQLKAVTNASAKSPITIFHLSDSNFSTDYVQLGEGENNIVFSIENISGQLEEHSIKVSVDFLPRGA